ncbi:hypothetical protein RJ639_007090 [Escallonia herrerae]|uniref:Uncharacterized protein n=1 Tax=Escallonia herrerae TaxID=1293975 RepID=A0AA88W3Y7_9ASTE|nr:hypothetical protein RJ639_007090 [Escallonia herrerae]
MMKALCHLLLALIFTSAQATSIIQLPQHQLLSLVTTNTTQDVTSCSFGVSIMTSCSSTRFTRDQISLAFGDAYDNQVYAPRLDDPSTRTFESCSVDIFQIYGPCTYQICYLYLYRSGYDGWRPETVEVYSYNLSAITFYYNTSIPRDVWYGFNYCSGGATASAPTLTVKCWQFFVFTVLYLVLNV